MGSNIQKRRMVRALEAKRDKLLEAQQKNREALVVVRSQLKEARKK